MPWRPRSICAGVWWGSLCTHTVTQRPEGNGGGGQRGLREPQGRWHFRADSLAVVLAKVPRIQTPC